MPPGSQRSVGQHIYAVMANPEILKHVGRNCEDPEVSAIRNLYKHKKFVHEVKNASHCGDARARAL